MSESSRCTQMFVTETLYDLTVDPAELTNLAVRKLDPAARETAVDTLVDEMTRADDMTRPESMSAGTGSA